VTLPYSRLHQEEQLLRQPAQTGQRWQNDAASGGTRGKTNGLPERLDSLGIAPRESFCALFLRSVFSAAWILVLSAGSPQRTSFQGRALFRQGRTVSTNAETKTQTNAKNRIETQNRIRIQSELALRQPAFPGKVVTPIEGGCGRDRSRFSVNVRELALPFRFFPHREGRQGAAPAFHAFQNAKGKP
jgi:hypothetical protein